MTSIISFVLSLIIVGILYKNMIAWEGDYRISRGQALLPVLLGLLSVPLSFVFFLIIGLTFRAVTGLYLQMDLYYLPVSIMRFFLQR